MKSAKPLILFLPLQLIQDSTQSTPRIIRALKERYSVIGVEQTKFFGTKNLPLRFARYLKYQLSVLVFALSNRKNICLIFCVHSWYGVLGIVISKIMGLPLVWDSHSGRREYGTTQVGVLSILQNSLDSYVSRYANITIVRTQMDKQAFLHNGVQEDDILVLPDSADFEFLGQMAYGTPTPKDSHSKDVQTLFFMGSRMYEPNRKAAFWINSILVPKLIEEFPSVRAIIASDGPLPDRIHDSVSFVGHVHNVYQLIIESTIGIVPIWSGNGMLNKVIDLLALARPCVVTKLVTKGIPEIRDSENALVACDEIDFIKKTKYLLKHPELARTIANSARNTVLDYYDWKVHKERLFSCLESVVRCR